ncbi:Zinc finger protein Eos [Folsomia candida]|uniref:Zinc finger protein Eos n=1 Tax=Folsomia candida TaxID=158441 RepID=A0A226DQ74_FOLCA|nr:Zinc finger protein Eos [Folsomia candida]
MEALNLNLKHDIQSQQRLFDILQSSSSSGGGGPHHGHGHSGGSSSSSSIEFMLRSYDHQQDHDLIAAFNFNQKDHLARHVKNMHPTYAVLLNKEDFLSLTSSATLAKIGVVSNRTKIAPAPSPTKSSSNPRSTKASLRIPVINSQQPGGGNLSASPDGKKSLNSSPPREDNNDTRNRSASSSSSLSSSCSRQEETTTKSHPQQGQVQSQNRPSLSYSTTSTTVTKTTTTSSPKLPKPPKRSLLQPNGNGLVSLTNLSLTLGGQIKEAPFANCSPNKKQQLNMTLQCHECGVTCNNEKDLATHLRGHKPQNFRCPDCPRAYTRREKLSEHIRCFHQGQKFKCEHCGKEV